MQMQSEIKQHKNKEEDVFWRYMLCFDINILVLESFYGFHLFRNYNAPKRLELISWFIDNTFLFKVHSQSVDLN